MSSRRRAKRMARNHRRMAKPARLNLVALMDIFTILVLFLIVNNGDVEVLQADRRVALPDSVSEQRPEPTVIIKITESDILLAGERITGIDEALAGDGDTIAALADALTATAAQQPPALEEDVTHGRPIVIMGDRTTPYALLKRVMATCAQGDYRDISLAVNSVPVASPPKDDALAMAATGTGR